MIALTEETSRRINWNK